MKITCQSCGAKYTIADEKIRGRTVKIRCKKCSSPIVVNGVEAAAENPEPEGEDATRVYDPAEQAAAMAGASSWTITGGEGDQHTVTEQELMQLYASGAINAETYAWREGMPDWLPLGQIPEAMQLLQGGAPAAAPTPEQQLGQAIAAPEAAAPRAAARRADRDRGKDLFGAAARAGSEEDIATSAPASPQAMRPKPPRFTAERGENSVLFSIDALRAGNLKAAAAAKPAQEEVVDFGQVTSMAPPPMNSSPLDDLGYQAPVSGFVNTTLAAPTLPTEPEPEPAPATSAAASYPPPAKSNKGLIIGLAAALGLFVVATLGIGGYVLFGGSSDAPATAASAPAATTGEKLALNDTKTAAQDTPSEPKAAEEKTAKDEPEPAAAAEPDKGTQDKADEAKTTKTASTSTKQASTSTAGKTAGTPTKTDTKKEEPKAEPPKEAAPASGGNAPFSRSAAISALSTAASAAAGCKQAGGPTGRGRVSVTFAPSGRVTTATVNGPPFAGTSVGGCVAAQFRRATVPPFSGSPVTVHKSFSIQ